MITPNVTSSTPWTWVQKDTTQTLYEIRPWIIVLVLLTVAVVGDQVNYILKKGNIAGPTWKIPFIGPFLESMDPKFEAYYAKWTSGPLSCVSVFHKFVVIASTRDMSRKVFNSPNFAKPCLVDSAPKFLGADNWVFLDGKAHTEFRKGLVGLFSRKALAYYLPGQEAVYREYFQQFVRVTKEAGGKPVPFVHEFREAMCALSCAAFVGQHLPKESFAEISSNYYRITAALELVNFPIILPYTRAWYGKKASDFVLRAFSECAAKSRIHMRAGGRITCIMDAWVKEILDSAAWREAQARGLDTSKMEKPTPLLRAFSDYEIAQTVFTFFFASQDAATSACTWMFQIMAQRPDVLDRVREENLRVRQGDPLASVSLGQLESMTYTRAVIREVLRYRPPVLMVPYMAKKSFPISDTYTVPKGTIIVPTVYMALHDPEVYPKPDIFDPERYYTGDAEAKGAQNYLVFGSGPHVCIGQHYTMLCLMLGIGLASTLLDWTHHATPLSEEIGVFATIFPKDDCPLTFSDRV